MTATKRRQRQLSLLILSSALLLRILTSIHPHSGQDDYQGPSSASIPSPNPPSTKASYAHVKKTHPGTKYGGDYEAQRHWMELTYHLPVRKWYYYDLDYWGLDYPPLTAYVSYFFGWMAHNLGHRYDGLVVLKDLVALDTSRGFENSKGKLYMRCSVLLMDLLVYFSSVWVLLPRLVGFRDNINEQKEGRRVRLLAMALLQPAILLMDHGHFQYNTVSLGLALWSFHFMTMHTNPFSKSGESSSFVGPVFGSVLFSLALNFKQMELYHAPAVFAYLLGRCFSTYTIKQQAESKNRVQNASMIQSVTRFCALGITVILTFAILWLPFAVDLHSNTLQFHLEGVAQVVKRIFPFQRGLFEGKVSNLWCALSVKPISIRKRVSERILPFMALGLTLLLIVPPCWYLFRVGKGENSADATTTKQNSKKTCKHESKETSDLKFLLWGSTATSLAFFLASFQVHEKGILIPLAPLSLLILEAPQFVAWFSVVATWTLWPLVVVDRLGSAYACCVVFFLCLDNLTRVSTAASLDVFSTRPIKYIIHLSAAIMVLLHLADLQIAPPPKLPDLFPVLWSLVGCGLFSFSYLVTLWAIVKMSNHVDRSMKHNGASSKKKRVPIVGLSVLAMVALPTSEGFMLTQNRGYTSSSQLSFSSINDLFTDDILVRAREPLYWETQRADDAKPILDLSKKDGDILTLSDEAKVNKNEPSEEASTKNIYDAETVWECGHIWLETERYLVSMGLLLNETATEQPNPKLMKSAAMIDRAPQLIRLPTCQVIDSTNFFLDDGLTLAPLVQYDPTILTYCADDLYYGIEYLSNMMTRGNRTQAIQMIRTQSVLSPTTALSLFKMGVDGGIDERRVSDALGNAAASGKAVEYTVGDAGRSYREFKRLKDGKRSLG